MLTRPRHAETAWARPLVFAAAVLSTALWAYACGDGATEPTPTPDPPRATTVTVTPATAHQLAALGATVQLSARVLDQNGQVMTGAAVTWSSSATLVATVDASGLVTAVGGGAATITATAGSASGTATVMVAQEISAVTVTPAADTVVQGDTLRLTAEAFDENGHPVDGTEFTWSSSDVSVATVDGPGLVRGVAEGTATITATAGDAAGTSEITVEKPDRSGLRALYNATGGPGWTNNTNWLSDAPFGDWHGVTTNNQGRVTGLDLSRNELNGAMPPELGRLSSLAVLSLSGNALTGPIPPELGNLTGLTELWLWDNALTGPMPPELGNLTSLTDLRLDANALTGPVPPELGNLTSLTDLWLHANALTGSIPPELGNLTSLTRLFLDGTELTGPLPLSLKGLPLRRFYYYATDLCVPLDASFRAWLNTIEDHRGTDVGCASGSRESRRPGGGSAEGGSGDPPLTLYPRWWRVRRQNDRARHSGGCRGQFRALRGPGDARGHPERPPPPVAGGRRERDSRPRRRHRSGRVMRRSTSGFWPMPGAPWHIGCCIQQETRLGFPHDEYLTGKGYVGRCRRGIIPNLIAGGEGGFSDRTPRPA